MLRMVVANLTGGSNGERWVAGFGFPEGLGSNQITILNSRNHLMKNGM